MSDQDKFEQMDDTQDRYTSQRQERRSGRHAARQADGSGWMVGLVLITIGGLYLLHNAGILPIFTNWWALFLLLPGVGTLSAALGAYRRNGGHWTAAVTGPFLSGLLFVGLTAIFLFDLNYGWLWPLFLIAAGLLLLFRPTLSRS